jgi:transposase-like protein
MKKATKSIAPTSDEVVRTNKRGRPSIFTQELRTEILSQIAEGKSIRTICRQEGMPSMQSIFYWLAENEDFSEQYVRAKKEQAHALSEDILELAEEVRQGKIDPNAGRVAGDLKKWSASKLLPRIYGDKLDLTTDGKEMPAPIIAINALPNVTNDNKREYIEAEVPKNAALDQAGQKSNIMDELNA